MKKVLIVFIIMLKVNLFSQVTYNDTSFKQRIFSLKIHKKDSVTDKSFNKGEFIFQKTIKSGLKTGGDYRNLGVALFYLGEDKNLIKFAIDKAFSLSPEVMFSFYDFLKKKDSIQYNIEIRRFPSIKDKLLKFEERKGNQTTISEKTNNLSFYCDKNNLNTNLVRLISSIKDSDQRYRDQDYIKNLAQQKELDSINLQIIDSLYKKHNTYIGESLVGKKFSHIMWLIIQHSNINKMQEYLPIVIEAVKSKELSLTPLKMLIDRIYTIKYDYQIFGSQMGVDLAKEKVRKRVIAKYELDSLE